VYFAKALRAFSSLTNFPQKLETLWIIGLDFRYMPSFRPTASCQGLKYTTFQPSLAGTVQTATTIAIKKNALAQKPDKDKDCITIELYSRFRRAHKSAQLDVGNRNA
jgi:hypothetical protein